MRVLVVGSGGREHALCLRLAQDESVDAVLSAPGNPGMAEVGATFDVKATDGPALLQTCRDNGVDLVVIGPERPLVAGVADFLRESDVAVYGPSAACARIEGSKAFAKELMAEAEVPTGESATFTDISEACDYIESHWPVVVKASGEAMGKGVAVINNVAAAQEAARAMLSGEAFGDAGRTIVVEERLQGEEVSLLAVCSGESYRVLPGAKDYKRAFDGDQGPNTGGMGAVSPSGHDLRSYASAFIAPVLRHFAERGTPYVGTLYAGLMLTEKGAMCLEYNARFGDPETQVILPRVRGDFAALLYAAATGAQLPDFEESADTVVCVVVAAGGYPGEYPKGLVLASLDFPEVQAIQAGTQLQDGKLVSSGGRVLGLVAAAPTKASARDLAYAAAQRFAAPEWHFRTDIAL